MNESPTMDTLVSEALRKYPKAKKIAVENFCFTAPEDKTANQWNLTEDARMYKWNRETVAAITDILRRANKM